MAKWSELKKQGVKRCGAYFTSGKRCRRHATKEGDWCAKHKPFFDAADELNRRAIESCLK